MHVIRGARQLLTGSLNDIAVTAGISDFFTPNHATLAPKIKPAMTERFCVDKSIQSNV